VKYGLCEKCKNSIIPVQGDKCRICGKPLVSEIELCLSCRNRTERSYDRLWVLFPYMGKYRTLLTEYKFKKKLVLACFFAELITDVILNEPLLKDAVLIPVPPRPGKIKDDGWDQIDYLFKKLKKSVYDKIIINHCLKRKRSRIQKKLKRTERLENMKGSIVIKGKSPKTALIIDDVITTGSTMEVCAQILKENGAEKVYGLCIFYD